MAHQTGPCPSRKAAWDRIKAGEGFIYLAKIGRRRLVKIGFALDPEKRMQFIGMWGKARLVAKVPYTLQQEQALHRVLDETPYAFRSEYYRPGALNHPACRAVFGASPALLREG